MLEGANSRIFGGFHPTLLPSDYRGGVVMVTATGERVVRER